MARRMRGHGRLGGLVAVAAVGALVALPSSAAASMPEVGTIAVDNAAQHVFVSEQAANAVDEFDFDGDLVATIPDIYGAWGMTISNGDLDVTEATTGRIV